MRFLSKASREIVERLAPLERRFEAKKTKDEDAELFIYDSIGGFWGGVNAKDVADALASMKGAKRLVVRINSPGGDVFEASAIYNLIRDFKAERTVKVDGLAASAASVIAMAGDKILTAANAMWMIHDPWGFSMGTAEEMRATANVLDKVRETILDTYVKRTAGTRGQISQWMADETWMTATEAKERGFTDLVEEEKASDEEGATAMAAEPFSASGYRVLGNFKKTPIALKRRGPSDARLAAAKACALRIRAQRSARSAA